MDIKRIFKKDYIIGLDIGVSSVKIAQFAEREDGLHLIRADLEEIALSSGEKEILVSLQKLIKGIDIKKSRFIVSVNCPKTAITRVTVPCMPRQELADGIRLEAKNYFPFPIDDSLLDYEVLGDIVEKGIRKYEVVVAVSPKSTVEKYLSLLGKIGIRPASFIPSSYALQRVAQELSAKEKTQCFVDIGKLHTELIICRGKYLLFSRKIPVAGEEFTRAMTGVLVSDRGRTELTLDEAEKIKRETGIPSETGSKIIDDKISTTQVLSMLRTPLEQLVSEIERCFDYYREESGGGKIDSLVLFGGGASLRGLIKYMSKSLSIEVKLGDSFRLGLAIGAALTEGKGINLLPPEIKEKAKRAFKRSGIEVTVVGAALILILFYIGMGIQLNNFQKNISVAKMELSSLGPELKQVAIFGLLAGEPYWDDVFKELSNIIPSDIYLMELSMENNMIRMRGIIRSQEPEESLSNFILTLERGLFRNVKLINTKEVAGKPANEFEITCWIDEK